MFRLITYVALALLALVGAFFGGRYSAQRSASKEEKPKSEPSKAEALRAEEKPKSPHDELREKLARLRPEQLEKILEMLLAQDLADLQRKAKGAGAAA